MEPQRRRGALRHHDLVGPGRIRHPAARDGETILVEEEAVDTPDEDDVAVEAAILDPSPFHEGGAQRFVALDPFHLWVPAHGVDEMLQMRRLTDARAAACRLDHEIRGIGRGKERRERRRGPTGGGERPEGDAADEADEEDEHEIARSLPPPTRHGPVPGGVEGRGARRARGGGPRPGHPLGRRGRRVLHCLSLPDFASTANVVSRCVDLVVPRTSTGPAWGVNPSAAV